MKYSYQVRNDGPTVVTTTSLGPNGNYVSTNSLYDPQYRLRQVQTPTEGGRLLVDTRYDTQGRAYKVTQPYFTEALVDTKLWVASDTEVPGLVFTEFDGAGRPVESIYKAGANEKWRTSTSYGGDRVSVRPPAGATATTTITDARGQTSEVWQHKGPSPEGDHDTTKYTYTPAGKLASSTDPVGATWRWTYDLRGRQIKAEDADTGTSTNTYDDADQLLSVTDARGVTLAYDYDRLGRPKTVRDGGPAGPVRTETTYDSALLGKGKPAVSTRYVDGNAYAQRVDAYGTLGRPTQSALVVPAAEGVLRGTYTTHLGYTWTGSLASTVYPKAGPLLQEDMYIRRDDFDRPTSSYANYGRTVNLVTDMSYTRYGEPQRVQLGDAGKRTWLSSYYDTNTRRLDRSIVDAELAAPMQSDVNYTRDPAGNITSLKDDSPGAAERQCFAYDHLRRLTEAWTPAGDCSPAPLTSSLSGPAPYWHSLAYDSVGNRRTETQHASAGNTVRTYAYPQTGRALQSVRTQGPVTSRLDEFSYDAAGNTTRRKVDSTEQTLDWDQEGRLTKVTQAAGTTLFVHDAGGARLLRKDPTGTTLYLDGQELRLDSVGGNVTGSRYYSFDNGAVAMRTADGLTWLTGDHQGTARIAINSQTMAITQRRQTPFGATRGSVSVFPGEKGFVGGTIDSSIGLTSVGVRHYDSTTGRFLSVDPIMNRADPQSWNGYAYANNSPVTFSDPSGLVVSGPDGECARGCMYKPGRNPATNAPADRAWNSRECRSGEWSCLATGGRGKPPQNRSIHNCPDGGGTCRVVSGAKSPAQLDAERRALAQKKAEFLTRSLEQKVGPLGEEGDRYLREIKAKAADVLSKPTQSFSVCGTVQAGLIIHIESEMCFTGDDYGVTFNVADKTSIQLGGGGTAGLAFKANTERATEVNSKFTPSRSLGVDIVPAIGGGIEYEVDDDHQSSLTAKVEYGFRGGVGPKLTFEGTATNYGYIRRWQDF